MGGLEESGHPPRQATPAKVRLKSAGQDAEILDYVSLHIRLLSQD